jgi:hypothetical protein
MSETHNLYHIQDVFVDTVQDVRIKGSLWLMDRKKVYNELILLAPWEFLAKPPHYFLHHIKLFLTGLVDWLAGWLVF